MGPFVIIIFGATGDLAQHKLLPALFSLYKNKHLGEKFYVVGFARRELSDEAYRDMLREVLVSQDDPAWEAFAQNIYYQQGFFDEGKGYEQLITRLNGFDKAVGACITRLFYLATPPDNYQSILSHLQSTKLSEGCGQGSEKSRLPSLREGVSGQGTRLAIEKPFGKDLQTARELDKTLCDIFEEKQIYRVDHYLAKESVQNMIAFRFANGIFEPVWNNKYIDHVQITFSEKKGVGKRGKFFDGVGMLRDVAQNHLLQLLAAVAMEQPASFTKESVRDMRAKAIQAIRCINPDEVDKFVVRGQYKGYLDEKNVSAESQTETYIGMKLFVDTDRFSGVPFYLQAGKALHQDVVEIKIVFIQTCHLLFREYGCPEIGNVLTIRIQPNEGIGLRVNAKSPGSALSLGTVDMHFSYAEQFREPSTNAYDKLLLDILLGDQMLFNRSDELESSWQLISGILAGWEKQHEPLVQYEKGSFGPDISDALLQKDGKKWIR